MKKQISEILKTHGFVASKAGSWQRGIHAIADLKNEKFITLENYLHSRGDHPDYEYHETVAICDGMFAGRPSGKGWVRNNHFKVCAGQVGYSYLAHWMRLKVTDNANELCTK